MKIKIIFLVILSSTYLFAQSFSVFNIDTSAFPIIKAKFYAFDSSGKQILNLSPSDFSITENGIPRTVLNVSCPIPKPPVALSSVLVMDQSGSMSEGTKLQSIHEAAASWVKALPGKSECAITSFDTYNYIIQDFTTNRTLLEQKANTITANGGTDYNKALDDPMAGGILIAKTGKYRRVIVMMSDGEPNFTPNVQQIINNANANSIIVYFVSLGFPSPQCMKDITAQSGGKCFENVTSVEEAKDVYLKIMKSAVGGNPCDIEWTSGISCLATLTDVEIKIPSLNLEATASYQSPNTSVAKLEFVPSSIVFKNIIPGNNKDTTIKVTARNSDFNVSNITSSNPVFTINKTNFILKKDQSIDLTISFAPTDSGYCYSKFSFENDVCPNQIYYARGGWQGKRPIIKTIKLDHPNGGQVFLAGSDTVITWEGVTPQEKVKLEYSIDSGKTWKFITDTASGLSYKWHVPNTPSNMCLARVTALTEYEDCVVLIGNQIWMCKNLNVDHYRNGDPIPEVRDSALWVNLKTGAWCYYNNSDSLGSIYGKLYNWYAVNDPRGLAPVGWHVASDDEWIELEMCLGMTTAKAHYMDWRGADEGGKLKEAGIDHWIFPNYGATNISAFSALPGGFLSRGQFQSIGYFGYWWTSQEDFPNQNPLYAYCRGICNGDQRVYRSISEKYQGFSVRCVKDP